MVEIRSKVDTRRYPNYKIRVKYAAVFIIFKVYNKGFVCYSQARKNPCKRNLAYGFSTPAQLMIDAKIRFTVISTDG